MDCIRNDRRGVEILTDYCAGRLEPAQTAEFEAHMEQCSACREMAAAQRSIWEMLDAWAPVEVSEDFDARLYRRIARDEAAPAWKQWLEHVLRPATPYGWWKPLVSAAVAAGVLSLALLVRMPERTAPMPKNAPVATVSSSAEEIDLQQVVQALDDLDALAPSGQTGRL